MVELDNERILLVNFFLYRAYVFPTDYGTLRFMQIYERVFSILSVP